MGIFDNENPFQEGGLIFNRQFTLQQEDEDRLSDSSSKVKRTDVVEFLGTEPQLVQRLTENMVFLEEMAMQKSPFRIQTQTKGIEVRKGMCIYDQVAGKSYRLFAYYSHVQGIDFTVTEFDD